MEIFYVVSNLTNVPELVYGDMCFGPADVRVNKLLWGHGLFMSSVDVCCLLHQSNNNIEGITQHEAGTKAN